MSTPAATPAQATAQQQDPELLQAGFNATIEALVAQRDGALQSHANALSELRITQVLVQRAHAVAEAVKADLAAAHAEIERLNGLLTQKAEPAQTEQPAGEAVVS